MENDHKPKGKKAQAVENGGSARKEETSREFVGKSETGGEGAGKGKSKPAAAKPAAAKPAARTLEVCRTDGGRQYCNPIHYAHPYGSMLEFAKFLSLKFDANRTQHFRSRLEAAEWEVDAIRRPRTSASAISCTPGCRC